MLALSCLCIKQDVTAEPLERALPIVVDASEYPDLQAAFDAMPEAGGSVKLPPGDFELTRPLLITQENIQVEGAGPATHLINRNEEGEPALILKPKDYLTNKRVRIWRVQLADFRISGNPKSGDGLLAEGVNEIYIHGLSIDHNGGNGINLVDCTEDPRVADSIITYNSQTGLNILRGHDVIVNANQFEENLDAVRCIDSFNLCMNGNNLDDHLRHGVVIENTYGSVLSGNMIEECKGTAIVLDRDCYGITISANVIAHNFGGGVNLIDAWGCAVSANTFTIIPQRALVIGPGSGRITVTGNNFSDSHIGGETRREKSPATGVLLESTSDIVISGNIFTGLAQQAVKIVGECSRILVDGNVFADLSREISEKLFVFDLGSTGEVIVGDNIIEKGFELKPQKRQGDDPMKDLSSSDWIGHYACWGVPWVGKKHGSNTEYIVLYFRYPTYNPIPEDHDEDLYYAIYDTSSGTWTVTDQELADHSQDNRLQEAHPSWGYFGGEYHVFYNQTHGGIDDIAEIKSATWEGFSNYVISDNEYSPTGNIGGRYHHAALVRNESSEAWLIYSFNEGSDRYMGYTIWTSDKGWDGQTHKIGSTKNLTGSPTALESNGTIYVYFANDANDKIYLVSSSDSGSTWSDPIDTGVSAPDRSRATVQLNSENEFVMVYDVSDGVAVRKSADGIDFGSKRIVLPSAYTSHYTFIEGTDTAIIAHPDLASHGKTWDIYGSVVDLKNF